MSFRERNPMAESKTVTLTSCPTGGWVMGNRHTMAEAIKTEMGEGTQVQHRVGCPLMSVVSIDGRSKRQCMPLAMIVPCSRSCGVSAKSTGQTARALAGGSPGMPDEMLR